MPAQQSPEKGSIFRSTLKAMQNLIAPQEFVSIRGEVRFVNQGLILGLILGIWHPIVDRVDKGARFLIRSESVSSFNQTFPIVL